jgi:2'-5' RNA ligase
MVDVSPAKLYRLFIAISLPEAVKTRIEEAQAEWRDALGDDQIRWTRREQFHLTLKFLGGVDAGRLDALAEGLRRAAGAFAPLNLRAERMGFFPDARLPRVVWVGVHDDRQSLPSLQRAVESAAAEFTREQSTEKFAGHVTLGRVKGLSRAEAEKMSGLARSMAERRFGEWTADKVEVIRSELLPQGARYTTLIAIPLAGGSGS